MKIRNFITLCILFSALPAAAVEAVLSASPRRPVAGEPFTLELTVDSDRQFTRQLPSVPGLQISGSFSSNSLRRNIINGQVSVTAVYGMRAVAEKPGKVLIPPVTLDFGGEKVKTNSLELLVRDPASLPAGEKLSATLSITPSRPVYAGETLRADLEIFVPSPWQLRGIGNIVPENFADALFLTGKENFVQSSSLHRTGNGSAIELAGIFQVQSDGTFVPQCRLIVQLIKGSSDFFFGPPPENRTLIARSKTPLVVLPVPPAPAGTLNTRLTGKWQITGKVSKKEIKAGDIAEITLRFSGDQPTAFFRPPALEIPEARVYPPESKPENRNQVFTVKYPFVAMKPGSYRPELKLAVFDPEKKDFQIFTPDLSYQVLPNAALTVPPVSSAGTPSRPEVPEVAPGTKFTPLTLEVPGKTVDVPLWRNNLFSAAIALILIFAGLLIHLLPRKRDEKKKILRRELRELAGQIRKTSVSAAFREQGIAPLAEALNLSSGATLADLAGKMSDPELKEFLYGLEQRDFIPGHVPAEESRQIRQKMLKLIRKVMLWAAVLLLPSLNAAEFTAAKNAFDSGDFATASSLFAELADRNADQVDPALFYDLGCAGYMQENYPEAALYFTRAVLLDPQNRTFRQARQLAAGYLPEPHSDYENRYGFLRPDQYILLALWLIVPVVWIWVFRRKIPGGRIIAAVILLLALTAVGAGWQLLRTTYSCDRAMIVTRDAMLCSVPVRSGGREIRLPGGTGVVIREEKGDFYRVENADFSGWMEKRCVKRLFPYRFR